VAVLETISAEAYADPGLVRTAPHRSVCRRIDPASFDDPERWAITWRLYRRKA
jgi:glycine dehydrogenase subunit 2